MAAASTATYGRYVHHARRTSPTSPACRPTPAASPSSIPPTTAFSSPTATASARPRDGEICTLGANYRPADRRRLRQPHRRISRPQPDQPRRLRSPAQLQPADAAAFDPRELTFDRLEFRYGDAKTEDFNFFAQRRHAARRGWELLRLRLLRPARRPQRRQLPPARTPPPTATSRVLTPATTPNAANFVPLTPDGFLPLSTPISKIMPARSACAASSPAGTPISRSATAITASTIRSATRSTPRSARPARATFDAGGLRFGQFVANLDFSREFEIGLAGPLSVAVGVEYRDENFEIRPGDLQSYAPGPLFRASFATTAAELRDRRAASTMPAPASAASPAAPRRPARRASRAFPPASATDESRHSLAAYVELDTESVRRLHRRPRRPLRAFLRFRRHAERQARAPLRARRRASRCAARSRTASGRRRSTSNSSPPPRPTSSTACRSTSARSRSTARSPARSARATSSRKSRSTSASARPPIRSPGSPSRSTITRSTSTTGSCSPRISAPPARAPRRSTRRSRRCSTPTASRASARRASSSTASTRAPGHRRGRQPIASGTESLGNWTLTAAYNYNKTKIERRINDLGPLATIPGIVLFGRGRGHPLHRRPAARQDRAQRRRRARRFRADRAHHALRRVIAPGATAPIADPDSLTLLGPDDIVLGAKWITDLELRYGRRELAARDPRTISSTSIPIAPFGRAPRAASIRRTSSILSRARLAVRLQRPLPLRPGVVQVLPRWSRPSRRARLQLSLALAGAIFTSRTPGYRDRAFGLRPEKQVPAALDDFSGRRHQRTAYVRRYDRRDRIVVAHQDQRLGLRSRRNSALNSTRRHGDQLMESAAGVASFDAAELAYRTVG